MPQPMTTATTTVALFRSVTSACSAVISEAGEKKRKEQARCLCYTRTANSKDKHRNALAFKRR
jgi:hypothetical protein